jgi:hypothetical protein
MSASAKKKSPEKKIGPFAGGVGVSIWINEIQTESGPATVRSITINPPRYRDRDTREWKDSKSYRPSDLPALIFALQKAQEHCYEAPLPNGAKEVGDQDGEQEEVHF